MRILVTGCSGFIARYLIRDLHQKGHQLIGIDRRDIDADFGEIVDFTKGDIRDKDCVSSLASNIDIILHLAAEHQDFGVAKEEYYSVNVEGTHSLLDAATVNGVKKFIFYSSVAVYGDRQEPSTEAISPRPSNHYGKSKMQAEERICTWVEADSTREVIIIRPAVIFGSFNYANMYRLIRTIHKRRYLKVGMGKNIKSIGYVENIVAGTLFLLEHMKPGVEIYNYADYPQLTSAAIAEKIAQALEVKLCRFILPLRVTMFLAYPFDLVSKLTGKNLPITAYRIKKYAMSTHHTADKIRHLGFVPPCSIDTGINRMVDWYLQENSK
jgi:nucleoside-diphosphate-sugar epimerase